MTVSKTRFWMAAALLACVSAGQAGAAEEAKPLVDAGTRLAIAGDSITEQKLYSRYMEMYLMACAETRPEAVSQWGWSGERAPGFAARMENDLLFFKPTLLTTCYGMNDGTYRAYNDKIGTDYRNGMAAILKQARDNGITVLVGGPGAVDTATYRGHNNVDANVYNQTLGRLNGIARELAQADGLPFADVHQACLDAMKKAKAELGGNYAVMGRDGVHPGANGQLAMAFAFLKAMNPSPDIGKIDLDLAGGNPAASASAGHTAAVKEGVVEITSTRWPFCFTGGDADQSTLAMQRFLPFNDALNRFTLTVKNLAEPYAEVSWGADTRRFTKAELEQGVNLAAAFAGRTPFQDAWGRLEKAVADKQNFETWWIKHLRVLVRQLEQRTNKDPKVRESMERVWEAVLPHHAKQAELVRKALVPVKHTLSVTPVSAARMAEIEAAAKAPAPDLAAEGYRLVYDFDINNAGGDAIEYTTDKTAEAGAFTRVAYCLEIADRTGKEQWITVELDAFTDNAEKLGVPTGKNEARFQEAARNMAVRSNSGNVRTGEGLEGWMEIWPNNYNGKNAKNVANATNAYDWGDTMEPNVKVGYGSLQLHNPAARQVLFAVNNWRAGANTLDIGIGNNPNGNVDYTFRKNGDLYPTKRLRIYVK